MPGGRDRGEDVIPVGTVASGDAERSHRQRLEPIGEQADGAVVTSEQVH
jgi:hypothetical protein